MTQAFGKRAGDLVKELVAAGSDSLPPYNVSNEADLLASNFDASQSQSCDCNRLHSDMRHLYTLDPRWCPDTARLVLQDEMVRLVLEEIAEHSQTLRELSG